MVMGYFAIGTSPNRAAQRSLDNGRRRPASSLSASIQGGNAVSTNQPIDPNLAPVGVGKENSPDPDDPDAAPIVDLGDSHIEPDPAYKDDVPVGTPDADEDARRAGGSR